MVIRLTAAVVSQTFLGAAAAALYNKNPGYAFGVAALAIVLAIIASFAIVIGGGVLRAWHKHGMKLIAVDNGAVPRGANQIGKIKIDMWWREPGADNFLRARYLKRLQPDWRHRWTMEFFPPTLPVLFGIGWGVFICVATSDPCAWYVFVFGLIIWTALLVLVGRRAGRGMVLPDEQYLIDLNLALTPPVSRDDPRER